MVVDPPANKTNDWFYDLKTPLVFLKGFSRSFGSNRHAKAASFAECECERNETDRRLEQ